MARNLEGESQKSSVYLRGHEKDIAPHELVFTSEQQMILERKNFIIYQLTGQSVVSLREQGYPFWSYWYEDEPLEAVVSFRTEVAINPHTFFLPKSNEKTLDEQLSMMEEFSRKIESDVAGTIAILGNVADYTELAFVHLRKKGQRLFGKDFDYHYTRTTTPVDESLVALVGCFEDDGGLSIDFNHKNDCYRSVWVVPLVIPASAVGR